MSFNVVSIHQLVSLKELAQRNLHSLSIRCPNGTLQMILLRNLFSQVVMACSDHAMRDLQTVRMVWEHLASWPDFVHEVEAIEAKEILLDVEPLYKCCALFSKIVINDDISVEDREIIHNGYWYSTNGIRRILEQLSLRRAWPLIRQKLVDDVGVPEDEGIPDSRADAPRISSWLKDSANAEDLSCFDTLRLDSCGLCAIPEELKYCTRLYHLSLTDNQIFEWPHHVLRDLPRLGILDLTGNRIQFLPENIFRDLPCLARLTLTGNRIQHLPENVFQGLIHLQEIDLSFNQIAVLPERLFLGLKKLQVIRFGCCEDTKWPQNIFCGLTHLRYIDFGENQHLKIPSYILDPLREHCATLYAGSIVVYDPTWHPQGDPYPD